VRSIVLRHSRHVFASLSELAARAWASRGGRIVLVAVGVTVLFAVFVSILPPLLARGDFEGDAERLKAQNDVRTTLLQALAGAFLLLGLYFTARTLQLNREGQITERFTRAIDQLGDDGVAVRLGGIYALERLAVDSQKDRETIFEVLAAYIRERSRPDESESGCGRAADTDDEEQSQEQHVDAREDVRAAATVLGRRKTTARDRPLDLRGANLASMNLQKADFALANLGGANLEGAFLEGANFWRAGFEGANLNDAYLSNAIFEDGYLRSASFVKAFFGGANLVRAYLGHANLVNADLGWANLSGATFDGAHLEDANFSGAILVDANFASATISRADFTEARGTEHVRGLNEALGYDEAIGLPPIPTESGHEL
jgi:hypothetical protein